MIRRRHRRARIGFPRCTVEGCRNRRLDGQRFCSACWYALGSAVRLAIGEARDAGRHADLWRLCKDSARSLARRASAERGGRPAVAMCGLCQRSAADPVVHSCTNSCCPFALELAA